MPNIETLKSHATNAILLPPRVVFSPLLWIVQKIDRAIRKVLGYLGSIGVFSFGAWNNSWLKRKIIEGYKFLAQGRLQFDENRLLKAFATLEGVGGVRTSTFSKDGTKLDTMFIRYQDVVKRLKEHGWSISEKKVLIGKKEAIGKEELYYCKEVYFGADEKMDVLLPDTKHPKWKEMEGHLSNLGMERIKLTRTDGTTAEGYITGHWKSGSQRPKEGLTFVRANSPTSSFPFAKKFIMKEVLGLRANCLLWDPPGTWKSEGVPTEGGYYLAGETMVEKAVYDYGINWKDIWLEGFCLGGAVAVHLKKKYHEKGVNLLTENTFDCMRHTFHQQPWPANILAPLGLDEVRSQDPWTRMRVEQDSFNNVRKLDSLKGKYGKAILLNTDSDKIVHPESPSRLERAAEKVSEKVYSYIYKHPDKTRDGHGFDVLGVQEVWDKVVEWIATPAI